MLRRDIEIVIGNIRYVSDKDASEEIKSMIVSRGGDVTIAEIVKTKRLPFDQVRRIVNAWS